MNNELSLPIVQISTHDIFGGAEKIAWNLFQAYRERGLKSWLVVGHKHSSDPHVFQLPNDSYRGQWARLWRMIGTQFSPLASRVRGGWQFQTLLYGLGRPRWWFDTQKGYEDFDFPGTGQILNLLPLRPGIIHCHNLHGGYFDLRVLPWLSRQAFVCLTLHDAWLLSGHCAHSFKCERWRVGCGHCPDLKLYPAIPRDATAHNWRRKQSIFSQSRLYVATPSQWLMQKVQQSMLAPAIVEARVIHNGVDLAVFHPAERRAVRAKLGLSPEARVLLFTANGIRRNIYKDYQTLRAALSEVTGRMHGQELCFIALGEDAPAERIGTTEIRFIPYQKEAEAVASYYQAADLYLHAAHVDTFPTTILEALACGTPVIATAVGGIPEQVKSLVAAGLDYPEYSQTDATGILVPPQGVKEMVSAIECLLSDDILRNRLAENAARDAQNRFSLNRQVEEYLAWYQEIVQSQPIKGNN